MSTKTLVSFALLILLAISSAPATRPQSQKEAKKPRKTIVADSQRYNKEEADDESSGRESRAGEEWFGRGYQLHGSDRYPEAIEAFKRAVDLDYRKATAMYNIACGYSLLNDKDNAIAWLKRSLESGFSSTDLLANDSDLDPLRTDIRFKQILTNVPADNDSEWSGEGKGYARDRLEQANLDFARLEREASTDGNEWANVGLKLLLLRELDRSIIALNRAVDRLDYKGSTAMYNLACAYALKKDRSAGILWLEKSVNAGFDSPEKLQNDPDINSLRADPRFAQIQKLSNTLSLSQFRKHIDDAGNSDSDYSKERWAPAVELYESLVRTEPQIGRAWFNLGYALHFSHQHTRAITAFERALGLGYSKPNSTYNIACAYAMLNQKDAAFEWLDRAIAAGFDSYGNLTRDRDLNNLKSDPRFKRFVDKAKLRDKEKSKEMSW